MTPTHRGWIPRPLAKVDLYSQRFSSPCMRAKGLLARKGVNYNEFIIDSDEENREVMLKRSGGKQTVPQIFINGRAIGGWEQLEALETSGELDQLLAQPPHSFDSEDGGAPAEVIHHPDDPPRQGLLSRLFRP